MDSYHRKRNVKSNSPSDTLARIPIKRTARLKTYCNVRSRVSCPLVAVAVLIALYLMVSPTRFTHPEISWWKGGVVYHIYVRSFFDTNGDGTGDIRGVVEKVGYVQELGVTTIQLSPVYESPMVDFGYDVSNHTQVDPIFGTLSDFDDLVKELHTRGMKLIIDFIPNHTSDKHPWFQQSKLDDPEYTDFYIWSDGKRQDDGTHAPPNNWVSKFGGPAWSWHSGRNQYYYHRYDVKMPDLNYQNPKVVKAMQDVMRFWLQRGVDGLRVDAMEGISEEPNLNLDEPRTHRHDMKPGDYGYLEHVRTTAQQGSLTILKAFHSVIPEYEKKFQKEIILMPELNVQKTHPEFWFGTYDYGGAMPFNKALLSSLKPGCKGHGIHKAVQYVTQHVLFDKGSHWISWVSETHDNQRLVSRLGRGMAEVGLALTLLLPGTGFTYYGQELGMSDITLTYEQTRDPKGRNAGPENYQKKSRDPGRSPMQWSSERNAGFSSADKTWLPVHPDYTKINVQSQLSDPKSVLNSYRRLIELRKQLPFLLGQHYPMVVNKQIYSFVRINPSHHYPNFIVAMNVGPKSSIDNYRDTKVYLEVPEEETTVRLTLPSMGKVCYQSSNWDQDLVGTMISIEHLKLARGQVIVIEI